MTVYLDHNATTDILSEVKDEFLLAMASPYNASSVHSFGREAKNIISKAKFRVREAIGSESAEVMFTATSTEASNIAIKGLDGVRSIITSKVEHNSILKTVSSIGDKETIFVNVNSDGLISLDELDAALSKAKAPALVSIQLANSETGVIQPIREISQLALKHKAYIHTDATQALGKVNISFDELGVDMASIAGHKIGAGHGAAALIYKKGLHFKALTHGGGQQLGYRSGTENIAAIAALTKACELIDVDKFKKHTLALRDYLENQLIDRNWKIFAKESNRLVNTLLASDTKTNSETMLIKADLAGICISAGSACSSGKVSESYVLKAMGISDAQSRGAIRISLGITSTKEHLDTFLKEMV